MREDNPVLIPQRRLAMTLTVAGLDVHRGCLIRYIISLFQSPKFVNQELTQACMMIFNHARPVFNYIFKLYYTSLKKGKEIKVWLLNERKKKLLQPTLVFLF